MFLTFFISSGSLDDLQAIYNWRDEAEVRLQGVVVNQCINDYTNTYRDKQLLWKITSDPY